MEVAIPLGETVSTLYRSMNAALDALVVAQVNDIDSSMGMCDSEEEKHKCETDLCEAEEKYHMTCERFFTVCLPYIVSQDWISVFLMCVFDWAASIQFVPPVCSTYSVTALTADIIHRIIALFDKCCSYRVDRKYFPVYVALYKLREGIRSTGRSCCGGSSIIYSYPATITKDDLLKNFRPQHSRDTDTKETRVLMVLADHLYKAAFNRLCSLGFTSKESV